MELWLIQMVEGLHDTFSDVPNFGCCSIKFSMGVNQVFWLAPSGVYVKMPMLRKFIAICLVMLSMLLMGANLSL